MILFLYLSNKKYLIIFLNSHRVTGELYHLRNYKINYKSKMYTDGEGSKNTAFVDMWHYHLCGNPQKLTKSLGTHKQF